MLKNLQVNIHNYKLIRKIGKGAYGKVVLIQEEKTGKLYAAKIMVDTCDDPNSQIQLMNEAYIFSKVNYPTVLHFHGFDLKNFNSEPHPTFITDFIPKESLQVMLDSESNATAPIEWTSSSKYNVLYGIALSLNYLHSKKKIVHRDVKPTNVLLNVLKNNVYYPVICDFGLSKITTKELSKFLMNSTAGSPLYMAPEIFKGEIYTYKIDVYSFSLIAYQLITNQMLPTQFDVSKIFGIENQKFLEKCHDEDPNKRPNFYDICCFMAKKSFVNVFGNVNVDDVSSFFEFVNDNEDDADSLYFFGIFLLENEKDKKEALYYFEKAAEAGNIDAMFQCANMYYKGNSDVEVNKEKALLFFEKAAENVAEKVAKNEGDDADADEIRGADAMFMVAKMLDEGDGVEMNKMMALLYFKKAAEMNNQKAINILNQKNVDYKLRKKEILNDGKEENPINDPKVIKPSNDIKEAKQVNDAKEAKQVNDAKEAKPANDAKEAKPSNDAKEVKPSNDAKEIKPSNNIKEAKPANDVKEVKPINDPKYIRPSNDIKKAKPANDTKVTNPINNAKEAKPAKNANETIQIVDLNDKNVLKRAKKGQTQLNIVSIPEPIIPTSPRIAKKNSNTKTSPTFEYIKKPQFFEDQAKPPIITNPKKQERARSSNTSKVPEKNPVPERVLTPRRMDKNSNETENKKQFFKDRNGVIYTLNENDLTAEICSSEKAKGEICIESYIEFRSKQYKITRVGDNAFANSMIESLSFADSSFVTSIGKCAFKNSHISKFLIPAKLTELDLTSFQGADNLETIEVDPNNKVFKALNDFIIQNHFLIFAQRSFSGELNIHEQITRIGRYAFAHVNNIHSIILNFSSLTNIGSYGFYKCQNLEKIVIKTEKLAISHFSFAELKKLNSVELDCKELAIGNSCFENCIKLSNISFKNIQNIKFYINVFNGCESLDNFIIDKASSISFENKSFDGAYHLQNVMLNAHNLTLSDTFMNCSSLSNISIKTDQSISIQYTTFQNCYSLNKVEIISSSKITVCENAFYFKKRLKNVIFECDSINIQNKSFINCSSINSFRLKSNNEIIIPENAFVQCQSFLTFSVISLSSLIISQKFGKNSVSKICLSGKSVKIADDCFSECSKLTDVYIMQSRSVFIGQNQFLNCVDLKTIFIEIVNEPNLTAKVEFDRNCFPENLKEIILTGQNVKIINHLKDGVKSAIIHSADKVNIISNLK